MTLAGKRVLLIVGGGIAAFKALELIRLLRKAGCGVRAVLTAAGFKHPGHTEYLGEIAGTGVPPIMMLASAELRVVPVTVHEALDVFREHPKVLAALAPLADVGLDYLRLGQPVPHLSGGEAQRLKLAGHLAGTA